jgi:molybdopterin molybdotransferase
VVPYEKTQKQRLDDQVGVTLLHTPVPGENIQARGSEAPQGKEVLKIGTRIGAAEMGILASVGEIRPKVFSVPRLAICSTGDELVPPESIPLAHQIRQSNAPALISLLAQHGLVCHTTRHAPDHAATLRQELSELLQSHDVVILSGGVSMGKWDYVPQILQELGVREHLHTIAQKPGKPMWVGVGPNGQWVFGLPGNPVAALVCARRWVIPTLLRNLGQNALQARLQTDLKRLEKLTRFVIVQTHEQEATRWVSGLPSQGSGDYLALSHSSGFCVIPPGSGNLPAGSLVDFYPW